MFTTCHTTHVQACAAGGAARRHGSGADGGHDVGAHAGTAGHAVPDLPQVLMWGAMETLPTVLDCLPIRGNLHLPYIARSCMET